VLQSINFNRIPYAMRVESGATLAISHVHLFNLAPTSAYSYSSSTPWNNTGQGTTTWPSIALAVNATVRLLPQPESQNKRYGFAATEHSSSSSSSMSSFKDEQQHDHPIRNSMLSMSS
jgi:hypothetical protein